MFCKFDLKNQCIVTFISYFCSSNFVHLNIKLNLDQNIAVIYLYLSQIVKTNVLNIMPLLAALLALRQHTTIYKWC